MAKNRNFFQEILIKAYLKATEWLYGPLAWAYDLSAWLVSFGYWSRWRQDALAYLKPGKILETGFGTGSLMIEMKRRGLDVTGIEASWQMQRVTGWKSSRRGLALRQVCGRVQSLPFSRSMFSSVLSTFPTNYISDPDTLAEIHRVLAPAGRWVIVGLGLRFKSRMKQFLAGWFLGDWENSWIKLFTDRAEQAGFAPRLILCETDAYILPVLMLERNHEH